jgi:hypothetical protein
MFFDRPMLEGTGRDVNLDIRLFTSSDSDRRETR